MKTITRIALAGLLSMGTTLAWGQSLCSGGGPESGTGLGAAPTAAGGKQRLQMLMPTGAVANGGFENNAGVGTNLFFDWSVLDQVGGSGSWCVQTGTDSPINSATVPAPPEGSFTAMSDQTGPGSHVLFQEIDIPANADVLSFQLYIQNSASDFIIPDPNTLAYDGDPNQQFRADLLDPAADVFTVDAGVLASIYQTQPGDPLVSGYSEITFDISAFAGQTVLLRFAEVDNQSNFRVGVDNVQILRQPIGSGGPRNVPTLSTWALLLMTLGLMMVAGGRLRRG